MPTLNPDITVFHSALVCRVKFNKTYFHAEIRSTYSRQISVPRTPRQIFTNAVTSAAFWWPNHLHETADLYPGRMRPVIGLFALFVVNSSKKVLAINLHPELDSKRFINSRTPKIFNFVGENYLNITPCQKHQMSPLNEKDSSAEFFFHFQDFGNFLDLVISYVSRSDDHKVPWESRLVL